MKTSLVLSILMGSLAVVFAQANDTPSMQELVQQGRRSQIVAKQWGTAQQTFTKALAIEPENLDALYGLGTALNELKQNDKAKDLFAKGSAIPPDQGRFQAGLGTCLANLKKYDLALTSFTKGLADQSLSGPERLSASLCPI